MFITKFSKRIFAGVWCYLRLQIIIPVLKLFVPYCVLLGLHDIIAYYHPFGWGIFLSWVPFLQDLTISYIIGGFGIFMFFINQGLFLLLDPEEREIQRLASEELPTYKAEYAEVKKKFERTQSELSRILTSRDYYKHLSEVEQGINQNLTDKLTKIQLELEQTRHTHNETQELLKRSQESLKESQSRETKTDELYRSAEARKDTEIETLLEKIIKPLTAELEQVRTRVGPKRNSDTPINTDPAYVSRNRPAASTSKQPPSASGSSSVNAASVSTGETAASSKDKPKAPEIPPMGPAPSPVQRKSATK